MLFTENSKVGDLLANEAATVVLEKHLPGISKNAMIGMAKGFTLKQLSGFPQAGMSPAKLAEVVADLEGVQ
ncbi:hypothetical protein [Bacillus sp. FJAT-28004]|uniref:hypothetical protein n=1 Tax=Bacillus sp. FJAT-28004 TaxID=1679165 RepID=UPI0006B4B69F|nr:hypothetical protein [Bacillus sp. FJAT-28004]